MIKNRYYLFSTIYEQYILIKISTDLIKLEIYLYINLNLLHKELANEYKKNQ